MESEIMEYLKRVYYFAKRIAKIVGEGDLVYMKQDVQSSGKKNAVACSSAVSADCDRRA